MTKEEEKYTTLDTEQCKWWVNFLFNIAKEKACNSHNFDDGEEIQAAQDKIIKALEQQLSEDCVNRQAVLDKAELIELEDGQSFMCIDPEDVKALPSVTPTHCMAEVRFSKEDLREICNERIEIECTHGTCKDCEHWKDSDGVFRRGIGAESKCPINIIEVYEGNFYCARFKKRGSEE